MKTSYLSCITLMLALACAAVPTALAGSVFQGHAYAVKMCAECHSVEATNEIEPLFDVPSFYVIAHMPGMSELAISVWLRTPHDQMPDFIIPLEDRENLATYIMSLKGKRLR